MSVLDVVQVVEGEVAPVECVSTTMSRHLHPGGRLRSQTLWRRLKASIDTVLSQTTLQELVSDHALVDSFAPLPSSPEESGGAWLRRWPMSEIAEEAGW